MAEFKQTNTLENIVGRAIYSGSISSRQLMTNAGALQAITQNHYTIDNNLQLRSDL